MLVVAAPGQGAQTPGFLADWVADGARGAQLASYSRASGHDLAHLGTDADAETIRDTQIAQPLLVAAALVTGTAALDGVVPDYFTGHSVGELAAAGLAGVISDEDAMRVVAERGRAMAAASAVAATGMTAVLGGDRAEVVATLERHGLTAANDNGPGQIVAAGTLDELAALAADPPAATRLIPLSVAGAFHTRHMASAVERLESAAGELAPKAPSAPVITNRDGLALTDGAEVLGRIVGQVARPVRWDLCMRTMSEAGVTGLLELTPGGTLTGIARRAMKGVATFALKTPGQLDEARAFCREHALQSGARR
ncbi:MAG: ACP S-malonyltransferase [Nocardioides sp.]